jgi:hypothetical protein
MHVVNHSPYDVCYVHAAPHNAEDWGADHLGVDEVIGPSDQRPFDMHAGTYKVMLRDCDRIPVMTAVDVASEITLTVGAEDVVTLRLDNQSSVAICDVVLSPPDKDLMASSERIDPGGVRIFYVTPSVYDLTVSDCERHTLAHERGVNVMDDLIIWTLAD